MKQLVSIGSNFTHTVEMRDIVLLVQHKFVPIVQNGKAQDILALNIQAKGKEVIKLHKDLVWDAPHRTGSFALV